MFEQLPDAYVDGGYHESVVPLDVSRLVATNDPVLGKEK